MNSAYVNKKMVITQLQRDILSLEGFKPKPGSVKEIVGLKSIEASFPNGIFPTGAIHEFLSFAPEQLAASDGFIAGLISSLIEKEGVCVWIGTALRLFAPALKQFGVEPHRAIFIKLRREKDVLWATEEALKCNGIAAVIAEVGELNFMQSRRLQLAVESSNVTGFILRTNQRKVCTTASTARWQITPLASELEEGMPGVGFPRWQVDLLKVRNGKTGSWQLEWTAGRFIVVADNEVVSIPEPIKKVG